jgi:hypothetical protein
MVPGHYQIAADRRIILRWHGDTSAPPGFSANLGGNRPVNSPGLPGKILTIDLALLQKQKDRGGKIIAQCPACAETGGDASGEVWDYHSFLRGSRLER